MSGDLSIELAGGRRTVHPGETLAGAVLLSNAGDRSCKALELTWGWEISGRIKSRRTAFQQDLLAGQLTGVGTRRFPFEVEVPPDAPFTYRGKRLDVRWFLRARADIPLAFDPRAEEEIEVEVPEGPPEPPPETPPPDLEPPESPPGLAMPLLGGLGAVLCLAAGGAALAFSLAEGEIGGAVAGGVFVLVGLLVAFQVVRPAIAGRKLGPTRVVVEPDRVRPGGAFLCRVAVVPPRDLRILRVTATLRCREKLRIRRLTSRFATDDTDMNRKEKSYLVFEEEVRLSDEVVADAGRQFDARAEIPVPRDAPPTFFSTYSQVVWEIEVRLALPWWPDLVEHREVEIGP